jgi:cellulose synthase/poly-beta-1,6-N-acetylglucosamine synthase-like glycosyltransferase
MARDSSEKELILCNLMVRRDVFMAQGGFRQDLYPNEENEFLNRLADSGWRVRYLPQAAVRRPRRENVSAFGLQAFRYGRGRMNQLLANPHPGDLVQLAPLAYGFAWLGLWAANGPARLGLALAAAYLLPMLFFSGKILVEGNPASALASLFLFPLRHAAYGLGLIAGLIVGGPAPGTGTFELRRIIRKRFSQPKKPRRVSKTKRR